MQSAAARITKEAKSAFSTAQRAPRVWKHQRKNEFFGAKEMLWSLWLLPFGFGLIIWSEITEN
jgi:hypothetical protein